MTNTSQSATDPTGWSIQPKSSEFVIICAPARSGTTMLGDAVRRAYQVAWPQEIFHSDYVHLQTREDEVRHRGNFFAYRLEQIRKEPELSLPTDANRTRLFDGYLSHLRDSFPEKQFLLDVKYSSWHHLDPYFRHPDVSPGLIDLVRKARIPVVQLRRNPFANYCSLERARQTGVWWKLKGEEVRPPSEEGIQLNVVECTWWMRSIVALHEQFADWFKGHPFCVLDYEQVLGPNGALTSRVTDCFTAAFGREPIDDLEVRYAKIAPGPGSFVKNLDELRAHLARNNEWQLLGLVENTLGEADDGAGSGSPP